MTKKYKKDNFIIFRISGQDRTVLERKVKAWKVKASISEYLRMILGMTNKDETRN